MSQQLAGKVAVVTGASKGIGAAIARHLAAAGAAVVVNFAHDAQGADRVVAEIAAAGGQALTLRADVTSEAEVARLFDETVRQLGRLDILVNNAGIYRFVPLEQVTVEHVRKHYDTNVLGLLLCTREAAKRFGAEGGSIVNVSSVAAFIAPPYGSVYAGTKAAVDAITLSLATELGPRKIRVNAINPGLIETEGLHATGMDEGEFAARTLRQTPLGRMGVPDDIAPAVVFLCSEAASWITGARFMISGGLR